MAMYAPIDREVYPLEMELKVQEITLFEKALRAHNANYQVGIERRVIGEKWEPEYRYIVLKWGPKTREVLLETSDPDQMIATLKMLISIEREPK